MNVIFDLGGVLFTWDPEAIITAHFPDAQVRDRVRQEFMRHEDWIELDRGALEPREAIPRVSRRTGVPEDAIAGLLQAVPPSLTPIPESVDLLRRVKVRGHRLFCLSNMQWATIQHLEASYSFWDLFDGRVISCRVQLCKPEPEIYSHVLAEYGLAPLETVFIDDMEVNVEAAARFGIQTIRFQSPEQCESRLRALGCL